MDNYINQNSQMKVQKEGNSNFYIKSRGAGSYLWSYRFSGVDDCPYQLSYEASWELVTLLVCNIPIGGEEWNWIHMYKMSYIWTAEKDVDHCK